MKKQAKKTVHKITNDFDYDFVLIGIISQQANFRLCRELNFSLELELTRKDDHSIFNKQRMEEQRFAMFEYISPVEEQYVLFSNKQRNKILIPEKPQFDYLMLVFSNSIPVDESSLLTSIKNTKFVLGAYLVDPASLKSKENLIF